MAWNSPENTRCPLFMPPVPSPMSDTLFSNPFPAATEEAWRALALKALKGADFDTKLVSHTADGIAIQPLAHRRAHAAHAAGARAGSRWAVAARMDHTDVNEANALALADLDGGADALVLVFHGSRGARGFGLPTSSAEVLGKALDGVMLDLIRTRLEPAPQSRITARQFAEITRQRRLSPAGLDVDFGFDPLGLLARTGVLMAPWSDIGTRLHDMIGEFGGQGFAGPFISCDARLVHEAGGSEAQELAWALASAVAYLRGLEAAGMPLGKAEQALSFALAIDADQFMGLAKIRALRRLFARVQQACGLDQRPVRIHAETSWRMLTKADTPVNMLRNAVAAFSAGVGGADSVSVLPHTSALGLSNGFARRVARNTQLILLDEAHLWRVIDPAAGAGSLEALTDELCDKAWDAFQQIEREGGLVASLVSGAFQARVAAVKARRDKDIARAKAPLTGTSAFANLGEKREGVLDVAPIAVRKVTAGSVTITPLAAHRLSEGFEALRDRADAMAAAGKAPTLFLALLGDPAAITARTGFARGFFEAGGISVITPDGFAEADGTTELVALTDAFKASGAAFACLCGTDESYAAEGADAAMALIASGATGVWLAGRPGEMEATLRAAGVGGFIFAGCDMVAALEKAFKLMDG